MAAGYAVFVPKMHSQCHLNFKLKLKIEFMNICIYFLAPHVVIYIMYNLSVLNKFETLCPKPYACL